MFSALPSKTTIGMTSLLPNQNIALDDSLDIHVDAYDSMFKEIAKFYDCIKKA